MVWDHFPDTLTAQLNAYRDASDEEVETLHASVSRSSHAAAPTAVVVDPDVSPSGRLYSLVADGKGSNTIHSYV
jgi:hypothetical protein